MKFWRRALDLLGTIGIIVGCGLFGAAGMQMKQVGIANSEYWQAAPVWVAGLIVFFTGIGLFALSDQLKKNPDHQPFVRPSNNQGPDDNAIAEEIKRLENADNNFPSKS